jgi:hypothetical protein
MDVYQARQEMDKQIQLERDEMDSKMKQERTSINLAIK